MFRFALSLLACLFCFGCASPELTAKYQAKLKEEIEAHKIPAVRLSEAQLAKLKEIAPNDQIAWYGAGLQSDGKTFVCLVTGRKNRSGSSTYLSLFTDTFDSEGSFQRSLAYLWSAKEVMNDCRRRGIEPPINLCRATVFGEVCAPKPSSA